MTGNYESPDSRSPLDRASKIPPMRVPGSTPPPVDPPNSFYSNEAPPTEFPASVYPSAVQDRPVPPPEPRRRRIIPVNLRLPKSWQFWGIVSVFALTGLGGLSVAVLLKLPALLCFGLRLRLRCVYTAPSWQEKSAPLATC
jgi:hypothetical protein